MGIQEDCGISGPPRLFSIDWSRPEHQRSVAASLVQATYLLERDRQEASNALAPSLCERFDFMLAHKLHDDEEFESSVFADFAIYGAIYKSITPPPAAVTSSFAQSNGLENAPKFVIAFRGTLLKKKSSLRDVQLDLRSVINNLHSSARCKNAFESTRKLVADAGPENVWIAGHSLGAAIATVVGKKLAEDGSPVRTFLFNPPFISTVVALFIPRMLKKPLHIVHDCTVAAIMTVKGKSREQSFDRLCKWVPNVYVNPGDCICSDYIPYFLHREPMDKSGTGGAWRLAAGRSVRNMFLQHFMGMSVDAQHRLPSANLIVNSTLQDAHGIHQWWNPDQVMPSQIYLFEQNLPSAALYGDERRCTAPPSISKSDSEQYSAGCTRHPSMVESRSSDAFTNIPL